MRDLYESFSNLPECAFSQSTTCGSMDHHRGLPQEGRHPGCRQRYVDCCQRHAAWASDPDIRPRFSENFPSHRTPLFSHPVWPTNFSFHISHSTFLAFQLSTQHFFPSPEPATGLGSTTNAERRDLASAEPTAQSDRPRLSSKGTMESPARRGRRWRPCPAAVHDRCKLRKPPAEDRAESTGADWAAHPARVHRQSAPQGELAASGAQSSPSQSPESKDSTRHASAAHRAGSTQPPPAPHASPRAQSEDDPHRTLPIHLAPPHCHAAPTHNPCSLVSEPRLFVTTQVFSLKATAQAEGSSGA